MSVDLRSAVIGPGGEVERFRTPEEQRATLPYPKHDALQPVWVWVFQQKGLRRHRARASFCAEAAVLAKLAGVVFRHDGRVSVTATGLRGKPLSAEEIGAAWLSLDHPARAQALLDVLRAEKRGPFKPRRRASPLACHGS